MKNKRAVRLQFDELPTPKDRVHTLGCLPRVQHPRPSRANLYTQVCIRLNNNKLKNATRLRKRRKKEEKRFQVRKKRKRSTKRKKKGANKRELTVCSPFSPFLRVPWHFFHLYFSSFLYLFPPFLIFFFFIAIINIL